MDEKARQKKRAEERAGITDVTDDLYQPYPSPLPSEFWSNDSHSLFEEKSESNRPFRPSHIRKRVGRGGRIFIDRHVPRRDYKPLFSKGEKSENEWNEFQAKWKYDHSDSELTEEDILLDDNAQYAFTLYL
jgi:hypothetical protein